MLVAFTKEGTPTPWWWITEPGINVDYSFKENDS
jgi:hypothetical protein